MYNTTKNFEKAILGDNRTFRAKIKTGKYETEEGFISIKHYMKSTENSITVGGAVSSYVEIEMWKPDFLIENSELQIFIGIDVEDEENVLLDILGEKILDISSNNILTVSNQEKTEWVPLGFFIAQKPKNDNEIVTFTAYDRIESKLSGAFFSDLKYPIDAKKILEEISQKTGVPINISDLPNGVEIAQREVISESDVDEEGNETTTTTYENPFNGYTYREALGYIAMLYCRFAIADRTGTIKLVWYTNTDYEINTDRYYDDLVTQDEIFLVSKISCAVGDKTIYAGDGTTSISLENPVMTQERLDYIYNTIKELNFLPASTSFYGDIRMDIGDIVTLNDKYGNVIKIPLMSVTQEFDGGLLTAIQSYGSGEESTQSGGQITKMVNRTYTELFLVKEIVGTKASFDYVRAKVGEFEELSSKFLKVNDADIKYAKIDLANVNNAWIENGRIKKASITNAEIADATIEAAKIASINADTINSGSIKTKHLIIVSDDGTESIVGVINALNGVPEGEVNSKKIQAASIDVADLSAFQARIAGFKLEEYAIYTDKQSVTGKNGEIYLSTDRLFMGVGAIDMDLNTPFQVYANGSFRLVGQKSKFDFNSTTGDIDIEVSSLKIASKSVATSDDIESKVEKNEVISYINQSSEEIKINASKIDLSGYVTITSLAGNGTTTIDGSNIKTGTISADRLDVNSIFAKNITATGTITGAALNGATGSFSGKIESSSGKIGGWNIDAGSIWYSTDTHTVTMAPMTNANGDFLVVYDKANNTWPFFVRADGFHAYKGIIGGFTINNSSIYKGTDSIDSGTEGVYVGTDGISNVGSYGSAKIRDGHIELDSLILNYGNGISIYDFESNPNSINHFQINKNGYAYFREIDSYYNWLGSQKCGWYDNEGTGKLYCRYKENASGEYKYTNIAYIMNTLSGKAASEHTHNGVFVNTSVGYSGSKGTLYRVWKDKANHDFIVAAENGLDTAVGWTGSSTYKTSLNLRGQSIKCNGSTSWPSDQNLKNDIHDINDPYERFFYLLRPVTYRYNLGGSGRHHIGYIAQEVEQSLQESGLTSKDFAGFVTFELNRETETDENGYEQDVKNSESNYLLDQGINKQCNLAYTEFIALNTHMIQKQYAQIKKLQERCDTMLEQIKKLQDTILKSK